ncbi:MAG: heme exporter protein CcmD [Aquisalimonadaceae bacterium]
MSEFLAMGGYAFYVWTSFGAVLLVMLVNALEAARHHRQLRRRLERSQRRDSEQSARQAVHQTTLQRRG